MVTLQKIYGTSWCSDCKRTKQFLGEQRIRYEWIDITGKEEVGFFVDRISNGKRKIPVLVFDDGSTLVEPSNAELAEKLGLKIDLGHSFHDVVIIGGGPAGLTAALYCARDGLDVVVIEKGSLGGQASYTERLDNYPGFPDGIGGGELADRIVQQCTRFGVEFLTATDIVKIERKGYLTVITSTGEEITAKAMLIATGSKYQKLNVPGEEDLIGYKIHFCSTCDGPFYNDKTLAVIGGGNSAFEESIFLAKFAREVVIYSRSSWKASQVLQQKVSENEKIKLVLNAEVIKVNVGLKKTLLGLLMKNTETGDEYEITPNGVFLYVGLSPNTSIVLDILELEEGEFIKTGNDLMTNVSGLFTAGDCRQGSTKQAVAAMGEGAAAALHIRDYLRST